MKETYDIIIEKLTRDKNQFNKEVKRYIDDAEMDDLAKMKYYMAHAKRQYCMELIDMFLEVKNNL